jgi:ABC-type transporter Mla MlaB component
MTNKVRTSRRSAIYLIDELQGDSVKELELHWRESRAAGRSIQISLTDTEKIDDAGHTLLSHMFSHGAELVVGPVRGSRVREEEEVWLEIPASE